MKITGHSQKLTANPDSESMKRDYGTYGNNGTNGK
jgi:hypothetical protein